jgi:nicotinamide-nucleotide amidase
MKKHILYIGKSFIFNKPFKEYIQREIEDKLAHPNSISFYSENDNSLFLELEQFFQNKSVVVIVTTKHSFAIVGKLISTITADNQILQNKMLIPSRATMYDTNSYLINHNDSFINVLMVQEDTKAPKILLEEGEKDVIIHLFDEDLESANAVLEPLAQTYDVRITYTEIVSGWISLNIHSKRYGNIAHFISSAKQLLSKKLITASNVVLYIILKLETYGKKITFAESCTGGFLSSMFTKESGASNVFDGSLITYSNILKSNWLGVEDKVLEKYGAVSKEVVEQMSDGAINVSYTDYAISISGIAGPNGGTELKPVGTVCISVRNKKSQHSEQCHFNGDRNYIQEKSALYAIKMLILLDRETFF